MTATFADSVQRARRAIDCASALFREGLVPECHEYMVSALNLLLEGWASVAPAPESAELEPAGAERALTALERAGYRQAARLRAAVTSTAAPASLAAAPRCDVEWIWAEVERLASFSARRAMTPHARKVARRRVALASSLVLLLAVLLCLRLWGRSRVSASSEFSAAHPASNAVDGLEATEWLLPDATTGWIDVMFPTARSVHRVLLVNSHNLFYADRAAQAVRVTAFAGPSKAASVDGSFTRLTQDRSVLELPLEAKGVTRVRVELLSYFKAGGGLAEVDVR
jgi:hypothetical protein